MSVSINLNFIIYRIYENLRAQPALSDSIDIRELENWVINFRAKFLKQKIDKYPTAPLDESYLQDLGAVALEKVDSSNHSTLKTYLNMVRTTVDIPYAIETSAGLPLYTRIAPADKLEQRFKLVHVNALPFVGNGKFNKQEIFATQIGKRIYIYSKDPSFFEIKYINIRGAFGNPMEVFDFNETGLTLDAKYEKEFPINMSMAEDIILTATQMLYKFTVTGIEDNISNQADDAVNQGVQK